MSSLFASSFLLFVLMVGAAAYLLSPRRYESADSVAQSYDEWTQDGILEFYWGEHIHLGHYGSPPRQKARKKDFRQAKYDFVHEMVSGAA
jgi:MPBQ/MSBQ methyltransferase